MSKLSNGPIVTVTRSCSGCRYERSQSYKVQGDSGQHVECHHPKAPTKNYIGDTTWRTPDWCPASTAQQPAGSDVARDAERYRWLRAKENQDNEAWNHFGPYSSPQEIDAAIDAARQREGK